MKTIRRGIEILRTDGFVSFLRSLLRFIYWNLGIRSTYITIRHKLSGANTDVTIGSTSATLSVTTYAEFERFYDLKGERETLSDVLSEISEDDVFYDIGANVGLYSCLIGSDPSDCHIYLFEPHPTNVEALRQNLELNSINADIFQLALSDEEGTVELSSKGSEAGLGEHSLDTTESESTIPVTVRRLDTIRDEHNLPVPTVVKIDVEGAELNVLRGATETFSDPKCETIYCEVHPERVESFDGSYSEVQNQLIDLGFELAVLDREMGSRIMIKATK